MCGRYMLYYEKDIIIEAFNLVNDFDYSERFNIAPSQQVLTIVKGNDGNRAGHMKWGLIPKWAKDEKLGNKLINARSETINEKPAFKESFVQKRCLVPASGFYEWKLEGGKKQPYHFFLENKKPFAFAGIWSRWNRRSLEGSEEILTCSILTKDSNSSMKDFHHRMPVILLPEEGERWLKRDAEREDLLKLIADNGPEVRSSAVSVEVNKPDFDEPSCIAPLTK
jgi:putative SOS response-associated peptidase YedK